MSRPSHGCLLCARPCRCDATLSGDCTGCGECVAIIPLIEWDEQDAADVDELGEYRAEWEGTL